MNQIARLGVVTGSLLLWAVVFFLSFMIIKGTGLFAGLFGGWPWIYGYAVIIFSMILAVIRTVESTNDLGSE